MRLGRLGGMAAMLLAVLVLASVASAAINIETVLVDNPGNPKDPATGSVFGQVNYAYYIGKYEVTAGQYTAFLNAVAKTDTYGLYNTNMSNTTQGSGISRSGSPGSYTYSVHPAFVNRPVNYVSFGDAMRFANWLHNGQPTGPQNASTTEDGAYFVNGATSDAALQAVTRKAGWTWAVTSENEWYKAAYYNPATSSYYLYPTSSNTVPGRSLADLSGNNANYYGSPYPIQSPYYTTIVGEFQNSDSPYGTFDQGGNVLEWNEAVIGSSRGLRGGSFDFDSTSLRSLNRYGINARLEDKNIGFRVVQVPEPASLTLLALGGVAMFVRRRGALR